MAPAVVLRKAPVAPVCVGLIAFLVRLFIVLRTPGGLFGLTSYDPGVYYAAADALVHGRVPYRDFVLLHPPGVALATAPFALFGTWVSDEVGFVLATLAYMALGALNAALVVVVGRRLGLGRSAALVAGLVYALWFGAASSELTVRLEPLGTLCFLGALAFCAPGTTAPMRAGVLAGAACMTKIWWIVPLLVLGLALLHSDGTRACLRFLAGATASCAVILGPFLLLAPGATVRMVVLDQLGRPRGTSPGRRVLMISGLRSLYAHDRIAAAVLVVLTGTLVLALVARAWRREARLIVAVFALQALVLALAPTFFGFYADYVAASLALVVGAGVEGLMWTAPVVVAAASATSLVAIAGGAYPDRAFPAATLERDAEYARCVMSDTPSVLIRMNVLSRDLADGCPNWVDVTGRTYDVDAEPGNPIRRVNLLWQKDILRYLRSGDAVILAGWNTGLSRATRAAAQDDCLLGTSGAYRLYRTNATPRPALSPGACRDSQADRAHGLAEGGD